VSWSLVRTCRRCGTRAERPITTLEGVERAIFALTHHFQHPNSDDGCPSCDLELARDVRVDRDGYLAAVRRALRWRPQ
jgi:hypothetical protein